MRPPALQHGHYYVPLTGLTATDEFFEHLALALHLELGWHPGAEAAVMAFLQARELLVLLDGVEGLTGLSPLLSKILQACPRLTLLVTSRTRLCLSAEQVLPVQPWPEPSPVRGALSESPALALLEVRARQLAPTFTLPLDELEALRSLCRLVGGLPMGLELAAAPLAQRPLNALLSELQRSLIGLESPLQDIPAHHRSLTAALDWSWQLLSAEAQAVLLRLSSFCGSFGVEAALQVGQTNLVQLESLYRASLLQKEPSCSSRATPMAEQQNNIEVALDSRLSLSVPLQHYLRDKLQAAQRADVSQTSPHTAYYAGFMSAWLKQLPMEPSLADLSPLHSERFNLKRAWKNALHTRAWSSLHSLSVGLCLDYRLRGWKLEGHHFFEPAQAVLEAAWQEAPTLQLSELRAELEAKLGWLAFQAGQPERARPYLQRSVTGLPPEGAPQLRAGHLHAESALYVHLGAYAQAAPILTQALRLAEPLAASVPLLLGESLMLQAQLHHELQQLVQAQRVLERCRSHCEQTGLRRLEIRAQVAEGHVLLSQNAQAQARSRAEDALQLARTRGDLDGQLEALVLHFSLAKQQGKLRQALRWADEVSSLGCPTPAPATMVRFHVGLFWLHQRAGEHSRARLHLREAMRWGAAPIPRLLSLQRLAAAALWKLEQAESLEGRILSAGVLEDPLSTHPELAEARERLQKHPQRRSTKGENVPSSAHVRPEVLLSWLTREL